MQISINYECIVLSFKSIYIDTNEYFKEYLLCNLRQENDKEKYIICVTLHTKNVIYV